MLARRGSKLEVTDVFIYLFLAGILLPIAITNYTSVDTTTWSTSLKTLWDVFPVASFAGLVIGILYKAGLFKRR